MRYIIYPTPIRDDAGKDIMTCQQWLTQILKDDKANSTASDAIRSDDLADMIDKSDLMLELTEGDWEFLKGIVEAPTGGYRGAVARQFVPFMKAVRSADKEYVAPLVEEEDAADEDAARA